MIINAIERGYREKSPKAETKGAGLGLYMTYSLSNLFLVSRRPRVSTEIVCVIENTKRYRKYKERITSFHYFERGQV
jgi:sigma-B regulation protein RsbU (phosphoserine phosphatase)